MSLLVSQSLNFLITQHIKLRILLIGWTTHAPYYLHPMSCSNHGDISLTPGSPTKSQNRGPHSTTYGTYPSKSSISLAIAFSTERNDQQNFNSAILTLKTETHALLLLHLHRIQIPCSVKAYTLAWSHSSNSIAQSSKHAFSIPAHVHS